MAEQDAIAAPEPKEQGGQYLEDMFSSAPSDAGGGQHAYLEDMFAQHPSSLLERLDRAIPNPLSMLFGTDTTNKYASWDDYMQSSPAGRIMSAYGSAFKGPGVSEDTADALRQVGVFKPVEDGAADLHRGFWAGVMHPIVTSVQNFNEALIRPVAGAFDTTFRALGGLAPAAEQAALVAGASPENARQAASFVEYETMGRPGHPHPPLLPREVAEARAQGVIGEGEDGYFGTRPPTDEEIAQRAAAEADAAQQRDLGGEASATPPAETPAPEAAAGPTVDGLARQARPELFKEWDTLDAQRQDYARWLRELGDQRDQKLAAEGHPDVEAIDAQIADTERKLDNAGARNAKRFEATLDELHQQRAEILGRVSQQPTPDMLTVQGALQKVDYRMRDLATEVSGALREAEARMPATEQPLASEMVAPAAGSAENPSTSAENPSTSAAQPRNEASEAPAAPEPILSRAALEEDANARAEVAQSHRDYIIGDLTKKLQAVGANTEQARAQAEVVSRMYERYADLWDGKLGTAREIYDREAPSITLGGRKAPAARARVLAQEGAAERQTPEFKAWFGASKAVDENGQPVVLYHGTGDDIHQFDLDHRNRKDHGWLGRGVYLTDDPGLASTYASIKTWDLGRPANADRNVMPVYARMENPYYATVADKERLQHLTADESRAWTDSLKAQGHDGVILTYPKRNIHGVEGGGREYVVFNEGDVKSIHNQGSWDRSNPRILEQGAPISPEVAAKVRNTKVVDDSGQPLVVYKGMYPHDWRQETPGNPGPLITRIERSSPFPGWPESDLPSVNIGGFFGDRATASKFAQSTNGAVYPVYLNIERPFEIDANGASAQSVQFGEGGRAFRDAMLSDKYDGAIIRNTSDEGTIYVTRRGDQAHSIYGTNELEQARRGGITITDIGRRAIRMMSRADASTFMHETSHDWLLRMSKDALREDAPEALKKDVAAIYSWLGIDKHADLLEADSGRRSGFSKRAEDANEKFARGFERYLMEGRAPSRELADVFAKFRQWLTAIYESVQKLRAPITDDIRDIFDRMIVKTPEHTVVAPDVERPGGLGDIHAADASIAPAAAGEQIGDRMHGERVADVTAKRPDLAGKLDSGTETGEGAAPRPGADGGGSAAGPDAGGAPSGSPVGEVGTGGGQPPRAPPEPPKPVHLYVKVPKQPLTLSAWIKKRGGVAPKYRADIEAAVGKDAAGKLVNSKSGNTLEDLMTDALADGYFHDRVNTEQVPAEGQEGNAQNFNELLEKLALDKNTPQYSAYESDAVAAFENAIDHNKEVDELAAKYDIDTQGVHLAQFWDMVGEKQSIEALEKETESKIGDSEDQWRAAEEADRAAAEARGEEWHAAPPVSRTLEDLENERRAEEATRSAGTGPRQAQGPGPAAGGEGPVQAGPGLNRDGAGAAGRPGVQAAEAGAGAGRAGTAGSGAARERGADREAAGAGPTDPFGFSDAQFVDKAGNIRLDLLHAGKDVDEVLRQIAHANNDFADRRFGEEGRQLYNQVFATRVLLKQAGNDYVKKAAAVASLTEEEAAGTMGPEGDTVDHPAFEEMREAGDRLAMIQGQLAAITHQWGLAGQAFRDMGGLPSIGESRDLAQWAARSRTLSQADLRKEASLVGKLDTPAQRLKFLNQTRQSLYSRGRAMYIEYFVNNLISGPVTHLAYSVGNMATAFAKATIETPVAAAISVARGATGADRVYLREAWAQMASWGRGSLDGWDAAARAWREGTAELLPGEVVPGLFGDQATQPHAPQQGAIPGTVGNILRLPSRSVGSIHSFGRRIGYTQEIWRLAIRNAIGKGLEGAEFDRSVAQFISNPPEAAMMQATNEATRMVLMSRSKYGTSFWNLKRAVDQNVLAKTVAPFMQIGANLLHGAFLERTPIGLMDATIRDNIMGKNGAVARDTQLAKWAVGTSLAGGVIYAAVEGRISGSGPTDLDERREMMSKGWQPYSININGRWIPYRKYLGPLWAAVWRSGQRRGGGQGWHRWRHPRRGDLAGWRPVRGRGRRVLVPWRVQLRRGGAELGQAGGRAVPRRPGDRFRSVRGRDVADRAHGRSGRARGPHHVGAAEGAHSWHVAVADAEARHFWRRNPEPAGDLDHARAHRPGVQGDGGCRLLPVGGAALDPRRQTIGPAVRRLRAHLWPLREDAHRRHGFAAGLAGDPGPHPVQAAARRFPFGAGRGARGGDGWLGRDAQRYSAAGTRAEGRRPGLSRRRGRGGRSWSTSLNCFT